MPSSRPRLMMDVMGVRMKRRRQNPKKTHRGVTTPEIGSIYDILHDYAGTSLYLPPLCWTDLHIQVLGCRFVRQAPVDTPTPSSLPRKSPHTQASQTVVAICRALDSIMSADTSAYQQNEAVKTVLEKLFPYQLFPTSRELIIRCGKDRCVNGIHCQTIWKDPLISPSFESSTTCGLSSGSTVSKPIDIKAPFNTPVLAYLDRDYLKHIREHCFRIPLGPGGLFNAPIYNLQKIRSQKLFPKVPDEDHHILAIMLAMAQQHAYASVYTGEGFAPKDVKLRLLTVSKIDCSFVVYTSVIPAAFLALFHEPFKAPQGDSRVIINYQRVPVWPVLGLKERLGQALGKDLVGEFDVDHIETFEDEPVSSSSEDSDDIPDLKWETIFSKFNKRDGSTSNTPPVTPPSPKRKRHMLSQVFNTSFSEDRESSDYPRMNDEPAASSPPPDTSWISEDSPVSNGKSQEE